VFTADAVLAKHDETYMPREVVDDLKKRGLWEDGRPKPAGAPPKPMPVANAGGAGT
jgi:cytochrome c-type biogenesis protein CcmE